MTVSNIRLLFTLGAALPFSQEPGLQPVFTWTASLACGHFLGHLFRHLAGAGHQDPDEDMSQEQVAATPSRPQPSQQPPHENTPRGRMVRNTRQRMQDKRQKHLRGSFQKRNDKNSPEPAEPVPDNRGTLPVTEDRLLSEAARTLDNICSDYLCSLERKKDNGDCDGRKLSRLKTLSTVDVAETNQEYKIAVRSLQMLDLHKSQDDNDIQSSL